MTDSINPTERAIMEIVHNKTKNELQKRVPEIDAIHYRRLAYFLIETRRATYIENGCKRTLASILNEFGIDKSTYYDWHEKWHRLLPSNVKNLID